jgi:phospholipase C
MNARDVAALPLVFAAVTCSACSTPFTTENGVPLRPHSTTDAYPRHPRYGDLRRHIKHVFIIVQENRSLNNLFVGFPGAHTSLTGKAMGSFGDYLLHLKPVSMTSNDFDISHLWEDAQTAWNKGKMDGFNRERLVCHGGCPSPTYPYSYVPQEDVKPYWSIAKSWILADNFYPTEFGPSFAGHLNIIASTSEIDRNEAIVDVPKPGHQLKWGCDSEHGTTTWTVLPSRGPENDGPFPCFTAFHTMADNLDAAGVKWRYYAPPISDPSRGSIWSGFDAIKKVRDGPDWTNIKSPPSQILSDIARNDLADVGVTWVVPDWLNSDHAGNGSDKGPSWVASLVNAIGESNLWGSSVIVVIWDDWGGWYDRAPPPQLDFRGLGIRTPMLIISPYAKAHQDDGHVSHTQFETGSILRFIESVFDLTPLEKLSSDGNSFLNALGYTDQRSAGIGVTLDVRQSPRPFGAPIPAAYGEPYFKTQIPSYRLPDNQ